MCVTGNKYVDLTLAIGVTVATGGAAAPAIAAGGVTGIAAGAAVGALGGALTAGAMGGDVGQGALFGAITGGIGAGFGGGVAAAGTDPGLYQSVGQFGSFVSDPQLAYGLGFGAVSGIGGALSGMMSPQTPDYTGFTQASQVVQQQFNSQQIATTGSGGRQASASLAEAIQRSKQRKLSQADVGDLNIDTSAFASTGLQLA
jgi:hypothetical protein